MSASAAEIPLRIAPPTVDMECVEELRSLLRDAELGRIHGFALVALGGSDREVRWSVAGKEAKCNYLRLHGLLGWLQIKMLERWERR